ncbi:MAG: hypothetical protein Q9162_005384 [Coniocarpon cinnabarinum]
MPKHNGLAPVIEQRTFADASKVGAVSLGNTLRNNSLLDPLQAHDHSNHIQTQRAFGGGPTQPYESRRAPAFPMQSALCGDSEVPMSRAVPNGRLHNLKPTSQSSSQAPWNPCSMKFIPQEESLGKTYGDFRGNAGLPLNSDRRLPSAAGGAVAWKTAPRIAPTDRSTIPSPGLSLNVQANDVAYKVGQPDSVSPTDTRGLTNGSRLRSFPNNGPEAFPMSTTASSNGSQISPQHNPALQDLEQQFLRLGFSNGRRSQDKTPTHLTPDHSSSSYAQASMTRNGSSTGNPNSRSELGWNGILPDRWGSAADAATPTSDEYSPLYGVRNLDDVRFNGASRTGSNVRAPSVLPINSRAHQGRPFANDTHPVHNTKSASNLASYNGRNHMPNFRSLELEDDFHINNTYRPQALPYSAYRQPAHHSGEFNGILHYPPDLATGAMGYMGARYGQQWPNGGYLHPPPQSIPHMAEQDPSKVWRSALLEEFRMTRSSARWELKDVYGHIVEFAGDQHGSRFLQEKLKTANSEEKERVFQEILPNAVQLMKDVFGNYVLQKFFEHGDQTQKTTLVDKMKGHVYALSTQTYACRVVQKALSHILVQQQIVLMQEVDGKVMDCIKCENGNHVVQVAIEQVPLEHMPFMIEAVQHDIQYLSMHKYGCRIIQRMLEYAKEDVLSWLVPQLHKCAPLLISDQYGNYVPAHIVERGNPDDRNRIIGVVQQNVMQFSKQKFASHVVEKCIRFGTDQQRRDFMRQLCRQDARGENELEQLIRDGFANYVIQSLLDTLQPDDYTYFCRLLQPAVDRARIPPPNKQAENVARKMHRFDRNVLYQSQRPYMAAPTWNHSVLV